MALVMGGIRVVDVHKGTGDATAVELRGTRRRDHHLRTHRRTEMPADPAGRGGGGGGRGGSGRGGGRCGRDVSVR